MNSVQNSFQENFPNITSEHFTGSILTGQNQIFKQKNVLMYRTQLYNVNIRKLRIMYIRNISLK